MNPKRDERTHQAAGGEVAEATSAWHRPLRHCRADQLSVETAQSSGMARYAALSGATVGSEKIWMGEAHVAAGARSSDHHHGASETGIYVLSGHPVFVFLHDGEQTRITTEPGDYVYVPPFTPHREENPSTDEAAIVVLARSTQEAIVVNLPHL
jgi:uncharacterized RmlC-like cupin family protein